MPCIYYEIVIIFEYKEITSQNQHKICYGAKENQASETNQLLQLKKNAKEWIREKIKKGYEKSLLKYIVLNIMDQLMKM